MTNCLRNAFLPVLLAGLFAYAGVGNAQPSSNKVAEAIERGVRWLKAQIDGEGAVAGKPGSPMQEGGLDAMVVYTLLERENPLEPKMKLAIKHLQEFDIKGTYALGMRAQVWPYLRRSVEARNGVNADGKLLIERCRTQGEATGLFRYSTEGGDYDHSASSYGVLGMWACAQKGVEFPAGLWQTMDAAWRKHQLEDGGWSYDGTGKASLNMTTAGVATLLYSTFPALIHSRTTEN